MIIDKPGFYSSKAGKCEVVAIDGCQAIGWAKDRSGVCWYCDDGTLVGRDRFIDPRMYDITGPYVEPRKPVEAWAVVRANNGPQYLFGTKAAAEEFMDGWEGAELIHLREFWDL